MDALYAFMRMTDDIGDDVRLEVSQRAARLADWRRERRQRSPVNYRSIGSGRHWPRSYRLIAFPKNC